MLTKNLLFLMLLCIGFVSCSSDDGDDTGDKKYARVVKTTIENIEYIYADNASPLKSANNNSNAFYGVDKNGGTKPILFLTDNGDIIDQEITDIYDVNDNYLIMCGMFLTGEIGYNDPDDNGKRTTYPLYAFMVLVNKRDGHVYAFPETMGLNMFSHPSDKFFTDKQNNIYMYLGVIYKIRTNDADNVTSEIYYSENMNNVLNYGYLVNDDGILFTGRKRITGGKETIFRLPNERIIPLHYLINMDDGYLIDTFIGFDGNYYVIAAIGRDLPNIYRITQNDSELISEKIKELGNDYIREFYPNHKKKEHISIVNNELVIFNEQTNVVSREMIPDDIINIGNYSNINITSDAFYITVVNRLYRMDLDTYQFTKIDIKDYEIRSLISSKRFPELSFSGLRYSDGKRVIGNIDKNGKISTITALSESPNEVTQLIRLN